MCSPKLCTTFTGCKGLESHRRKLEAEGQDQGEMRGHLADNDIDKNAGRRAQLRNATLYAGMSTTVSVRASNCKGRVAVRVAAMKLPIFVTANAVEDR